MTTFESSFTTGLGATPDPRVNAAGSGDGLLAAVQSVSALGVTRADYAALADAEVLAGQKALAVLERELDTRKAWMAGVLAERSRYELGQSGLAAQQGHLSPEALIQDLTGGSKNDAYKLVRVGAMLAETEAAEAAAAAAQAAREAAEAEAERRKLERDLDPDGAAGGDGDLDDAGLFLPEEPVELPWHAAISHAVAAGTLSVGKADAIRRGLGEINEVVTGPLLAAAVAKLLEAAQTLNLDQLVKRARQTRDSLDADGIRKREQQAWDNRYLKMWTDVSGQLHVNALFPPEQAAFVQATFDSLTGPKRGGVRFVDPEREAWSQKVKNDPRTVDQIACDGFIDLLKAGTSVNPDQMLGGRRPVVQVVTTVDPEQPAATNEAVAATEAVTADAPTAKTATELTADDILVGEPGSSGHGYLEGNSAPVTQETVDRFICDTGTMLMAFDTRGRPLDVGREERLFNPRQRAAMAIRDGGCQWPGCEKTPSFTETHHLEEWAKDHGATDINVGILLCRGHHLLLHNQGWQIFENQGKFWLRPPVSVDPGQVLIPLHRERPGED